MRIPLCLLLLTQVGCVSSTPETDLGNLTRAIETFAQESKDRDTAILALLDKQDTNIRTTQQKIVQLEIEIESLESGLDEINLNIDAFVSRVGNIESNLTNIEREIGTEFSIIKDQLRYIEQLSNQFAEFDEAFISLATRVNEIREIIQELQDREDWLPESFIEQWELKGQ